MGVAGIPECWLLGECRRLKLEGVTDEEELERRAIAEWIVEKVYLRKLRAKGKR